MSLCACMCWWPGPTDKVTSKKSFSSRSSLKATEMLDSKSFHRRQNFSEVVILIEEAFKMWSTLFCLAALQFLANLADSSERTSIKYGCQRVGFCEAS